jgi:hypothetical protein
MKVFAITKKRLAALSSTRAALVGRAEPEEMTE